MSWLRDKVGRFSRPRSPAVAETAEETAPSLSPMMQHAVAWLEGSPAGDRLAAMLAEPQPAPKGGAEPDRAPLQEVLENVSALVERPLGPAERDAHQVWFDLESEGWTSEGLRDVAMYAAREGLDPRLAARALENATRALPAISSGRSWRSLDRVAERENERAYEALSIGDFETWERYSLPAALRAVRGG